MPPHRRAAKAKAAGKPRAKAKANCNSARSVPFDFAAEFAEYQGRPTEEQFQIEYAARQKPGPGDHGDVLAAFAKTSGAVRAGIGASRLSQAAPKTELEWVEYYARQKPGPGQHHLPRFPSDLPTQKRAAFGASTWSLPRLYAAAPR